MKKSLLLTLAILLFPAVAHAQIAIRFGWAAPPPVYEVSPGVQVVEGADEDIFYTGGHYWVQRGGRWYWANDYHEHWVRARGPRPAFFNNYHRGEFAHWRHEDHPDGYHGYRPGVRAEERHDARVQHQEVRHEERAVEHHEERREERHEH